MKKFIAMFLGLLILIFNFSILAQTTGAGESTSFKIQSLFIPVIVLMCVVAVFLAIGLFLRNYIKVPPNQVAVIKDLKDKKVILIKGKKYKICSVPLHSKNNFNLPDNFLKEISDL